jgi:hypothetical protein
MGLRPALRADRRRFFCYENRYENRYEDQRYQTSAN